MKYTRVRLFVVAVACCAMAFTANSASAGWGHLGGGSTGSAYGGYGSSGGAYAAYGYGSTGGSSGGYASSYGSSGGGGGSSGGAGYGSYGGGSSGGTAAGPGPVRRFFAHLHDHIHAKHARRAAYGSSGYTAAGYGSSGGAYYAGYGSSGGSGGSYVTSYGSSGGYGAGYGSSGGAVSYGSSGYGSSGYGASYGSTGGYGSAGVGTPVAPYTSGYLGVSNQSPATAASLASHQTTESDAVYLSVSVPVSAKVFVNDLPTTSTGPSRQFVSRGLSAGKKYKFEVRAEVVGADGELVTESKTVTLTAGQRDEISFNSITGTPIETAVTLNVPADAKVILAGNETNASGETRTFRTSQLKAGEQWDDYTVEVLHNGKVKRETLRLVAGDDIALTFNFDDDKSLVASR